eukprot:gb/GECG01007972.1/.p1 GENE.gb/GECG01007972.1/~~gb/GECG01007972.1/.p1  ORF type:complete len:132 (+),score=9.43 gb/GECG01007972.1/:1-396(+)
MAGINLHCSLLQPVQAVDARNEIPAMHPSEQQWFRDKFLDGVSPELSWTLTKLDQGVDARRTQFYTLVDCVKRALSPQESEERVFRACAMREHVGRRTLVVQGMELLHGRGYNIVWGSIGSCAEILRTTPC